MQKSEPGSLSSINMEIVSSLAETFLKHPDEYLSLLTESCSNFKLSKTLFFMVLMQSLQMQNSSMFSHIPSLLLNAKAYQFYCSFHFFAHLACQNRSCLVEIHDLMVILQVLSVYLIWLS